MSDAVIKVENLSKYYRLGLIGGGTLREDVNRAIAKLRGKPDPLLRVGDVDHGNRKGGQIWALRDVSFDVNEGEILGVIGGNGAGKSTLLKILSRITAPTDGRVKIRGRVGSLLEVGTGFHPELTGRENIYLNGTILGMNRAEVSLKLEEIVEFAEMQKFIDTPVKRYSSGMTVRLAFAVAAHLEPEILIVDEVLAVGDANFQQKCIGKMQNVASSGRTVLFVSHNLTTISNLCDRALLLSKGEVKFDSDTETAIEHYLGSGSGLGGQVRWEHGIANKGVDEISFVAVSLRNHQGEISDQMRSNKPFRIEIELCAKKTFRNLRVGIMLTTNGGITVFDTYDTDTIREGMVREKGFYRLACEVPEELLAAG